MIGQVTQELDLTVCDTLQILSVCGQSTASTVHWMACHHTILTDKKVVTEEKDVRSEDDIPSEIQDLPPPVID